MGLAEALDESRSYFTKKLGEHGSAPAGVDYNGVEAQTVRFEQLVRIIDARRKFSVIDYGCGYGALIDHIRSKGWEFEYWGYDMLDPMIEAARAHYGETGDIRFTTDASLLPLSEYVVASGIFNLKFGAKDDEWRDYTLSELSRMDKLCTKGFSFNMLTSYSDPDRMRARPDAYFGDPLFYFDHCKRNYSKNVALLHDYVLYDFTILVRKEA